jgi:U3 small nucleolar RNA-associated protein 14
LILAPSHIETEANPWLTTNSPVLPASEYSKPAEIRNEDSSSSESGDEEKVEEPPNESYGVTTSQPKEYLNMPTTTKRVEIVQEENHEQHQMNIQEAFADDDVLAEFEKEKVNIDLSYLIKISL